MVATFPGSTDYNAASSTPVTFSIVVANSSLSGYVYIDYNNSGNRMITSGPYAGDYKYGIPDVTVMLYQGTTLVQTALTQSNGSYQFDSLPTGTYTLKETQPPQYQSGGIDTAGSGGAQSTDDTIGGIGLSGGQADTEYDFGEYLLTPGYLPKMLALASTTTDPGPAAQQAVDQTLDPPPVVKLGTSTTNYAASYTGGSSPVSVYIAPAATITYATGELASLTVTITNIQDGSSEGFVIGNQTFNAGTASPQTVTTPNGSLSAAYSAGVLTLTGVDSVSDYQSVLQTIEWQDTAASPNASPRYVTVVADDAFGPSNTATTTITDPPAPAKANQVHAAVVSKTPAAPVATKVATKVASKPIGANLADQVMASVNKWWLTR